MKFKHKPTIIEAIQFDGTNIMQMVKVWGPPFCRCLLEKWTSWDNLQCFRLSSLPGTMSVEPGDYVIQGVKNEFYSCKPDVFKEVYEPVLEIIPNPPGAD